MKKAALKLDSASAVGKLRIGLLGCGDIGPYNAAAVAAAPNAELVACYDPVPSLAEDLAQRYEAETACSVDALVEREDLDAVFISVPHHLHAPLAIQAARAGRHVIVEKPAANDLASAAEMIHEAERAGVLLTVCFPHRHEPAFAEARRLIDAGALGEFNGVIVRFLADRPPSYSRGGFSGRSNSNWRTSRAQAGGGVLIMNLPHYIELVRYLTGTEAELVAAAAPEASGDVEETIAISVSYGNGAIGSYFGSTTVPGTADGSTASEIELWGSDGHLIVDRTPQMWSLRALDGRRAGCWHRFESLPRINSRAVFVSRFATAVHRGEAPEVAPTDALAVQAFIEAAYRSIERKHGVKPGDVLTEIGR